MFLLTVIEDKIKILPSQFGRNSLDVMIIMMIMFGGRGK
jgi:hypothetical protein